MSDPRILGCCPCCAAGITAVAEAIARELEDRRDFYDPTVWLPDSDSRDAIGATAMRHAYDNAAQVARRHGRDADQAAAAPTCACCGQPTDCWTLAQVDGGEVLRCIGCTLDHPHNPAVHAAEPYGCQVDGGRRESH